MTDDPKPHRIVTSNLLLYTPEPRARVPLSRNLQRAHIEQMWAHGKNLEQLVGIKNAVQNPRAGGRGGALQDGHAVPGLGHA